MKFLLILLVASLAAAELSEKEADKRTETVTSLPIMDKRVMEQIAMDPAMTDMLNSTQCVFKPEDSRVTCRRMMENIECPAVIDTVVLGPKFERRLSVFGMSIMRMEKSIERVRYWLHPRKMDNSSYLPHSMKHPESGKEIDIVVGCGERWEDVAGLRITDCKCFERLVRMFDESSLRPHIARLETMPTIVQEVPLFGEILVLDKAVQKRWLWGYGWGGLGLGWGWGGFGWPYGGWGWGW